MGNDTDGSDTGAALARRRASTRRRPGESGEWEPADAVEPAPRTFEVASLIALVVAQIAWVLLLGYVVERALGTSLVP